jgi:hypothetical protein
MGRKSFRMQIAGAGAIPNVVWETPTERMIERRKSDDRRVGDRRRSVRGSEVTELPVLADAPAPAPARHTIVTIALVTFVSGAMVATAADRLRRRAGFGQVAQAARIQPMPATAIAPPAPPPVTPATTPVAAQAIAPPSPITPVILPLPSPEPEFLQARTAPETEPTAIAPRPDRPPVVAKAAPLPRGGLAPAIRPRRQAASAPSRTTEPDPFEATKPSASKKWVDPFAE